MEKIDSLIPPPTKNKSLKHFQQKLWNEFLFSVNFLDKNCDLEQRRSQDNQQNDILLNGTR